MYIYSNLYPPGRGVSAVSGSGVDSGRLFESHRGYIGHLFILLFLLVTIVAIVTIVITTMYHTTITVTPTTMMLSSVSIRGGEGFLIAVEHRSY